MAHLSGNMFNRYFSTPTSWALPGGNGSKPEKGTVGSELTRVLTWTWPGDAPDVDMTEIILLQVDASAVMLIYRPLN